MATEHQELQELLQTAAQNKMFDPRRKPVPGEAAVVQEKDIREHCQWEVLPNGMFIATGTTKPNLLPGAYTVSPTPEGRIVFHSKRILTDTLIDLGDSKSSQVIAGIRLFWTKKKRYQEKGILYKRGVLLWGPAGSGKTATLSLLTDDLIAMGGIVLLVQSPNLATAALPILRRIEPERPLIVVLEDIEEIVNSHGEHDLLALLDGEHQTDNVVNLATTNYPESLGMRIINRPSRFDEIHKIGMPSAEAREQYLWHILGDEHAKYPVAQWVRDTQGLSIAHLKELVVAVTCLEQEYDSVIDRLKSMKNAPRSAMYSDTVGFSVKAEAPTQMGVGAGRG